MPQDTVCSLINVHIYAIKIVWKRNKNQFVLYQNANKISGTQNLNF